MKFWKTINLVLITFISSLVLNITNSVSSQPAREFESVWDCYSNDSLLQIEESTQQRLQATDSNETEKQTLSKLKQGMSYKQARQMLLNEGWQALFNYSLVNQPHPNSTVNQIFHEQGWTEIVDCAGTGLGLCLFKFRNATGQVLEVTTANNFQESEESGLNSTIFSWSLSEQE